MKLYQRCSRWVSFWCIVLFVHCCIDYFFSVRRYDCGGGLSHHIKWRRELCFVAPRANRFVPSISAQFVPYHSSRLTQCCPQRWFGGLNLGWIAATSTLPPYPLGLLSVHLTWAHILFHRKFLQKVLISIVLVSPPHLISWNDCLCRVRCRCANGVNCCELLEAAVIIQFCFLY